MNEKNIRPDRYGPAVANLLAGDRLPELGPGEPNREAKKLLESLSTKNLFPSQKIRDEAMAQCCLSGLWLWHDFLDESHAISQEISTVEGSYWHAIMHRREPDYSNAKYWFRRVGRHATFPALAEQAAALCEQYSPDSAAAFLRGGQAWDPFEFVDLCEAVARERSRSDELARRVAQAEWQLLFDHCYRGAVGA